MRPVCTYTDFFVVTTGRNPRQTKAIWDEVHAGLKTEGLIPRTADGEREATWIIADYLVAGGRSVGTGGALGGSPFIAFTQAELIDRGKGRISRRVLSYQGLMREAIQVYTAGLKKYPESAKLLRQRASAVRKLSSYSATFCLNRVSR